MFKQTQQSTNINNSSLKLSLIISQISKIKKIKKSFLLMMFFVNEASEPSMKVDSYVLSTDCIQITELWYILQFPQKYNHGKSALKGNNFNKESTDDFSYVVIFVDLMILFWWRFFYLIQFLSIFNIFHKNITKLKNTKK